MDNPQARDILSEPVRTDADVLTRVAAVIGGRATGQRTLWLFFLGPDGLQSNVVVPIDPLPADPDTGLVGNVCRIISEVVSSGFPGGQAVVTLSRDGTAGHDERDERWLRALQDGAARHQTPIRMLCLATPAGVRELGPAVPVQAG